MTFGRTIVGQAEGEHDAIPPDHANQPPEAHAAEIGRSLGEQGEALLIIQDGEAEAVMQDIASYEQTQETMVLLSIPALGNRQVDEGTVQPAVDVIKALRA